MKITVVISSLLVNYQGRLDEKARVKSVPSTRNICRKWRQKISSDSF